MKKYYRKKLQDLEEKINIYDLNIDINKSYNAFVYSNKLNYENMSISEIYFKAFNDIENTIKGKYFYMYGKHLNLK